MTELLYLHDSQLFQASATVIEMHTTEDGRIALILDKTIFYPQGGGQPGDRGTIQSSYAQFVVNDVRLDQERIVYHFGSLQQGTFAPGDQVTLSIDQERRVTNSKLHSAGHLIDCAVSALKLPLQPTKGYHFPEGPYVEYSGTILNIPETTTALQAKINNLLASNIPIELCELSAAEATKRGIHAPAGKAARIVQFEGFEPCGCGGTHARYAGEIGPITIRKIKAKGNTIRISYEIKA